MGAPAPCRGAPLNGRAAAFPESPQPVADDAPQLAPDYRVEWSDPFCRWLREPAGRERFRAVSILDQRPLTLLLPGPDTPTAAISVRLATWARCNTGKLVCELYDEAGVRLDRCELPADGVRDGEHHLVARLSEAQTEPGRPLRLRVSSPGAAKQNCLALWVRDASAVRSVDRVRSFRMDRFFVYRPSGVRPSPQPVRAVLALPAETAERRLMTQAVSRAFPDAVVHAVGADDLAELWSRSRDADVVFLSEAVETFDTFSFALHRRGVCSVFVETAGGWEEAPAIRPTGLLAERVRERAAARRRCRFTLHAPGRLVDNAPDPPAADPRAAALEEPPRLEALLAAARARFTPPVTVLAKAPDGADARAALVGACFGQGYPGTIDLVLIGGEPLQAEAGAETEAPGYAGVRRLRSVADAELAIAGLGRAAGDAGSHELVILADGGGWSPDFIAAHVFEHADGQDVAVIGEVRDPGEPSRPAPSRDDVQPAGFLNCTAANLSFRRRSAAGFADLVRALVAEDPVERTRLEVRCAYDTYEAGVAFRHAAEARLVRPSGETPADPRPAGALEAVGRERPLFPLVARRWLSALPRGAERRLNIVTYRWHAPHQYELYKLAHRFTLATQIGGNQFIDHWPSIDRPLRPNARLKPAAEIDPAEYDLAILHFDEHVCAAHLSNGRLGASWGDPFAWLLSMPDLPKIAVCHGTPPFVGQFAADPEPLPAFELHESDRRGLVGVLAAAGAKVVCNSHQALEEWGFEDARVIWHGFDPQEWPPATYERQVLALDPDLQRPHYRGAFETLAVTALLGGEVEVGAPVHSAPTLDAYDTAAYAQRAFRAYVESVRPFSAYLNTTRRSPMPRTRGEAMIMGITPVCLRNHDVDRFIDNGVNGFYAEEPGELAAFLRFLFSDPERPRRLGAAARATALDLFNHDRYLRAWTALIDETV